MKIARSVAEVLSDHTALELECIDRLYLNVYVPLLQTGAGASHFFRPGQPCAVIRAHDADDPSLRQGFGALRTAT